MTGPTKSALLVGIVASLVTGCTAADLGDDFANNLLTDLAPYVFPRCYNAFTYASLLRLLALFGERVTMQFMSQSTGWADNFILAMAPLGIVTIIVSAIRVGGPSWLKAVIGRARENLAAAEVDLMSSTSKEVCELWNGLEVIRCMGSAPIREFICLVPKDTNNMTDDAKTEIEITTVEEARKRGYFVNSQ